MFSFKGFTMIFLPFVGVVALVHSLYQDFTIEKTQETSKLKKLAVLDFKNNTVKRKVSTSIVWSKIKTYEDLYLMDSVLTLENSEAVIKFDSGAEVELNPNSLIVLEMVKDTFSINFVRGNIYTKSKDKELKIKVNNKEIKLQNAQVAISANKISVLAGKVTSEGKVLEVVKNPFKIIRPERNQKLLINRKIGSVPIVWKRNKVKGPISIEISKDFEFKKMYKQLTSKNLNRFTARLPQGIYFFRLKGKIKGKNVYSPPQKFSLIFEMPTKLVYPRFNEVIRYKKTVPMVKFKWLAADLQEIFEVEVSKDRRFRKSETSHKFKNKNALIKLPKGEYFARVKSYNKYRKTPHLSRVTPFAITEYEILNAPMLEYPPNEEYFIKRLFDKKGIRLTWSEVPGAKFYRLKIAKDKEFKELISTVKVNNTGYTLPKLAGGDFFWDVRAIDQVGEEAKVSNNRKYQINDIPAMKLVYPKMRKIITAMRVEKEKEKIIFEWKGDKKPAKYFRLFVASNKSFSKDLMKFKTTKSKLNVKMPNKGEYFWNIKAFDEKDTLMNLSNIRTFTVNDYDYLPPPMLELPLAKAKIEYFNDIEMTFNWKKQEKAKEYLFKLYSGDKLLKEEKLKENLYKTKLPIKGKYSWVVNAIDKKDEQGKESEKRAFKIISEQRITLPENHEIRIE